MAPHQLEALAAEACYHKVAVIGDKVEGFLLVLPSTASYENDNFRLMMQSASARSSRVH
jgi:hypothetical protein